MIHSEILYEIIENPISGEWGKEGDGINVIRTANFTNEGYIDFTNVVKRNVDPAKITKKRLFNGDLIIEKSGGSPTQPVGRVVYFNQEGDFICNNFTSVLRAKSDLVYPKYLHYILFANHKYGLTNKFQNKTTGIINLQLKRYIKETKIPLPSLEEQKKIAAILDAADDYRQKTNALIDKYDQLIQGLFLETFGDPVTNPMGWDLDILNNVCSKITDGTHDSPPRLDNGVKFITGKHIRPYVIDYENSDYVDEEIHDIIYKRCNPEFGDVLYTNIGANLGTAAINIVKYEFSMKNVALLKPMNELITGKYIEFFLNSDNMKEKVLWIGSQGGAQQFLSLTHLRKLIISLPPISLQHQFAERVAQIGKQKQQAEASLVKAVELFSSLLQRAFKGELTN